MTIRLHHRPLVGRGTKNCGLPQLHAECKEPHGTEVAAREKTLEIPTFGASLRAPTVQKNAQPLIPPGGCKKIISPLQEPPGAVGTKREPSLRVLVGLLAHALVNVLVRIHLTMRVLVHINFHQRGCSKHRRQRDDLTQNSCPCSFHVLLQQQ